MTIAYPGSYFPPTKTRCRSIKGQKSATSSSSRSTRTCTRSQNRRTGKECSHLQTTDTATRRIRKWVPPMAKQISGLLRSKQRIRKRPSPTPCIHSHLHIWHASRHHTSRDGRRRRIHIPGYQHSLVVTQIQEVTVAMQKCFLCNRHTTNTKTAGPIATHAPYAEKWDTRESNAEASSRPKQHQSQYRLKTRGNIRKAPAPQKATDTDQCQKLTYD